MFGGNLKKFIVKRVLALFAVLAAVSLLFFEYRWMIFAGLLVGGLYSIVRFNYVSLAFSALISQAKRRIGATKGAVIYFVGQTATIILLAVAIRANLSFFVGVVAGILMIPFVIIINSITEILGITHNNFE